MPTIAPVLFAVVASLAQVDSSRLYGVVTATDGQRYEGYIRWDKNEASWADILHASKRIPEEQWEQSRRVGATRERGWLQRLAERVFDWGGDGFDFDSRTVESGIRFAHIMTLEPRGSGARLVLVSGQEIELRSGGDVGGSVRDVVVQSPRSGSVTLDWDDIERVDFLTAGPNAGAPADARLYGTLTTRSGDQFTGYVGWDVDEALDSDVLDGEEDGRDREIPFREIRAIERLDDDGARVRLRSGRELTLRDTNDVDDGNRGILISDPALGQARVDWDEFRSLVFSPAPRRGPDAAARAGRLRGTVQTTFDRAIEGEIRWDNDEEFTWEFLNGTANGVQLEIEFGAIRSIQRRGDHAALVTLRDGRDFLLTDSNDVNHDNRGIFVNPPGGEPVSLNWGAFRRVDFR